jgi:uncharacterized protein (TIGR03000 family)
VKSGKSKTVAFDFDAAPTTGLALNVPADAKVTLCGKQTSRQGEFRHFATDKLEPGMTWKDYTVVVSIERDGKQLS